MLKGEVVSDLPLRIERTDIDIIPVAQLVEYIACHPVLFALFQVFELIEQYCLKKLTDHSLKSQSNEQLQSSVDIQIKDPNSLPDSVGTAQKLVDDYVKFKKFKIRKKNEYGTKNLVDEFDCLLLEFFKDKSEDNLKKIQSYIQENPDLNYYPVTSILKLDGSGKMATNILAEYPDLLNKFFEIKKTQI